METRDALPFVRLSVNLLSGPAEPGRLGRLWPLHFFGQFYADISIFKNKTNLSSLTLKVLPLIAALVTEVNRICACTELMYMSVTIELVVLSTPIGEAFRQPWLLR